MIKESSYNPKSLKKTSHTSHLLEKKRERVTRAQLESIL